MQYSIPPTQIYLLHTTADPINSQDVDPQLMANRRPTASISQLVAGIPSFAIPITSDEIHDHSEEYSSVISLIEFKPIPLQYVSCFVTPSFMVFNSMLAVFLTPYWWYSTPILASYIRPPFCLIQYLPFPETSGYTFVDQLHPQPFAVLQRLRHLQNVSGLHKVVPHDWLSWFITPVEFITKVCGTQMRVSYNGGSPVVTMGFNTEIVIHDLDDWGVPPWLRKPPQRSRISTSWFSWDDLFLASLDDQKWWYRS